jgi:hypothetical protein
MPTRRDERDPKNAAPPALASRDFSARGFSARGFSARDLPPAAQRALAEAEERRRASAEHADAAREIGGRGGLDPARYGDWEVKGLASDF